MTTSIFTTLDQYCCSECGVLYGLERNYANRKNTQSRSWHCPNGHVQVFCESALQRAENAAKRAQELLDLERRRHENTSAELKRTEDRRRAEAAAKTRIKNRVAHGVCPCCKRTFRQLAAHMKTKHPSYAEAP